jgi:serine/threonine protein kinase
MNDTRITGGSVPEQERATALPSGTQVGAFTIQSILGFGGFGITYRARHQTLGKTFALKEYFPTQFSYRDRTHVRPTASGARDYQWGLDRFEKEAQALAKFKHPSIVDVSDIFSANGTAYMVLAYEPGSNLGEWLRDLGRPATQDELDGIVRPLLDAIELVHAHGMLHRDIAPDNILIRPGNAPVLIDFGAARDDLHHRAGPVTAVVKPGYSPPEQYQSDPAAQGPWTDIYGFGATLYFAVVGALPAEAGDRFDARSRTAAARKAGGTYRPGFLAAIDWALDPNPAARPQSVAEWRARLFADASKPPIDPPTPEEAAAAAKPSNGKLWALASAGALAAGAALAALVWPCSILGVACGSNPMVSTGPLQIEIALPKRSFSAGDDLSFRVKSNKDCYFLVYTVSPAGAVENHDPAEEGLFMGNALLRANEWRQLPAKGHATVKPDTGAFELGAVCSKEPLSTLGLSVAQLREPARGGKRSFSFAIDNAAKSATTDGIARASVSYEVKP